MSLILSIGVPLIILIIFPLILVYAFNHSYSGYSVPEFISSIMMILPMTLVIFPLILAADSLSTEYKNQTGLLLFVQPVHKGIIFLGKYLSYFLLNLIFVTISYLLIFISGFFFFHPSLVLEIIFPLLLSYIVAAVFSTAYLSITCFFNTFLNNSLFTAALMVFLGLIICQFIPPFPIQTRFFEGWFIPYFNLPFVCQFLIMVDNTFSIYGGMTPMWGELNLFLAYGFVLFYILAPIIFTAFKEQRKSLI